MMKIAGFGAGSVSQRYRSADPYQNFTDAQLWNKDIITQIPSFAEEFPRKLRRGPLL